MCPIIIVGAGIFRFGLFMAIFTIIFFYVKRLDMDTVFTALKKIPGITGGVAHEVASKLNRSDDVATKVDLAELKVELIDRMATLETKLVWYWVLAVSVIIGVLRFF